MYKKLLALLFLSPLVVSEELISLDDFFSSEKASSMNSAELTIYSLEKCSAVTFFSIGGDNPEIEDVGDIFLMTALAYRIDLEPEINDAVHMDNNLKTVQKYFKEYEYYYSDSAIDNSDEFFPDLMKSDLKFCVGVFEIINGDEE